MVINWEKFLILIFLNWVIVVLRMYNKLLIDVLKLFLRIWYNGCKIKLEECVIVGRRMKGVV